MRPATHSNRRFVIGQFLAASVAVLACMLPVQPALATCDNPRLIGFETYVYTPGVPVGTGQNGSTVSEGFLASFWALGYGNPLPELGVDNGTWDVLLDGWIYARPGLPAGGTAGGVSRTWAGSSRIDGCVDLLEGDRCMALLLNDQDGLSGAGTFALFTDAPNGLLNYELAQEISPPNFLFPLITLAPIPMPELLDLSETVISISGPGAEDVEPGVGLDLTCSREAVVGYKLYRQLLPSGSMLSSDSSIDDGNPETGWELAPGGVAAGGAPHPLGTDVVAPLACPTPGDLYYAISLVFDSDYETSYVSAAMGPLACDCSGNDQDGDGFCAGPAPRFDCDDDDPLTYPGGPDTCDGINHDCRDPAWPGLPSSEVDDDGDALSECEGDCDDTNPAVYPFAEEVCDGVANDCLAVNWPELLPHETDDDHDLTTECDGDCDDTNATIYVGAPEWCDGFNNDCNSPDWPAVDIVESDGDGDGFSVCEGDCDDSDSAVFPDAPQLCDGVNYNCYDRNWPGTPVIEVDNDGDGWSRCDGDCNDTNAAVFPGAEEACDGLANDCSAPEWPRLTPGEIDDDFDRFSECDGDCDDADASVYPGATQVCDGVNNDCSDPLWPEPSDIEIDDDGDGFSECDGDCADISASVYPGAPQICDGANTDCNDPAWPALSGNEFDDDGDGSSECDGDCNDSDAGVYPGAAEVCDGVNNDCSDPLWPELSDIEVDNDGDGFGECDGDCDDARPDVFPGAEESCDGVDNDCNDLIDDDADGADSDGDGVPNACDDDGGTRVDSDGDGVQDALDCAPLIPGVSAPPEPVGATLLMNRNGDHLLSWQSPSQGHVSNVYRGYSAPGTSWSYNHACLATEHTENHLDDMRVPLEGMAWYYLVSAKNICQESSLGIAGDKNEILATPPCPTAGADTDGDGVLDIADNCPTIPNADQDDADQDFVGDSCETD